MTVDVFLLGALAVLVLSSLSWLCSRSLTAGMILLLSVFLVGTSTKETLPFLQTEWVDVHPADVVLVALAVAAVLRLVRGQFPAMGKVMLILLSFLSAVAFLRGLLAFGLTDSGLEFRNDFYFFAGALYSSSFIQSRRDQLRTARSWVVVGLVLAAVATLSWMQSGLGGSGGTSIHGEFVDSRALLAPGALFILQAALIAAFAEVPGGRVIRRIALVVLLCCTVLLQHRTVWIAALLSFFVGWLVSRSTHRRGALVAVASLVLPALLALIFFEQATSPIQRTLGQSTQEALSGDSTLIWRLEGWDALLDDARDRSIPEAAFGAPYGAGFDRTIRGAELEVSPHSYYVQLFLRLGLIGCVLLILNYVQIVLLVAKNRRPDVTQPIAPAVVAALLSTQLIFFVTFGPNYEQGFLFGILLMASRQLQWTMEQQHVLVNPPSVSLAGTGREGIKV